MATATFAQQVAQKAMETPSDKVASDVEALRADIASLASSVSALAGAKLGMTMDDAHAKAEKTMAQMERAIRQNPTQATVIAVGIGFVIGLVMSR